MQDLDALRYPTGPMPSGQTYTPDQLATYLSAIDQFPRRFAALVGNWPDDRLDTFRAALTRLGLPLEGLDSSTGPGPDPTTR